MQDKESLYYNDSIDLDNTLLIYMLPRLKTYLDIADKNVDLEWEGNLFYFKEEFITLKKSLEIIIEEFEYVLSDTYRNSSRDVFVLFGEIFPHLWW